MTARRRLLFAVSISAMTILVILVVATYYRDNLLSWLNWGLTWNAFTPIIVYIIGALVVALAVSVAREFLKPRVRRARIYVKVENCQHWVGHVLGKKAPVGTLMNVGFRIENDDEETQLTGVKLECKSKEHPYQTAEESPKRPVILPHKRKRQYNHIFFIGGHEIQEDKLKCVFHLYYIHGEKKISHISTRR